MAIKIETITLRNLIGSVNCYLIRADKACIMVDTGLGGMRRDLLKRLEKSGPESNSFKLIVLTHGDFDHIGSAAFHIRAGYPGGGHSGPDPRVPVEGHTHRPDQ